jgi:hypothetical protein
MLGRLAKAAYLFAIALMIASYALSSAHSSPPPAPKLVSPDQPVEMWLC